MSDQGDAPTPSAAPAPPAGRPPKVGHRGRASGPTDSDNFETADIPELEYFVAPGPRGYPPLTDFLDIWDVDMMRRRDETNKTDHRTNLYHCDNLIVRRGQEFQIKIAFSRAYKPNEDKFAVEFVIGADPQYSKGTYLPVFPTKTRQSSWGGRVIQTNDNVVTMGITPAANCIVGKYHMYVAVQTPFGIRRTKRDNSRDLYVLFNPWAADDAVFLDNEAERQECVMNELGVIYHGAYDDVSERNWNYGQFNYGVLDACLYIMDRSEMPITNRGDPIKVTRKASAMLNSRDDDGVLVGNWSGDYTYGVAPTSWTGSTDILLSYSGSKMPVCYAQCWVYAAVFNSFLRCLGIPSRVVTNYYSAHDNDGNLKLDIILDDNGRIDRSRTKDSIWYQTNCKCGRWMYRCGPASVLAIKHGHICFPFDAPFVFAEVNSDVVFYSRKNDGTMEPVRVNKSHVGRMVLTKAVGSNGRRDITDQYKFPEGSPEERTVLEKAEEFGCKQEKSSPPEADVNVVLPTLEISVGNDFEFNVEFVNQSLQKRTVQAYVSGSVVYYTGVSSNEFLFKTPTVTIPAQKSENYLAHLVEQANLNFIVTGKIKETGRIVTAMKVVTLHTPKLTVEVSGGSRVNEEMMASVQFTNPFSFNLENVHLRMEGPGVMELKSRYYSLLPGGSSLTWTEMFTPQRAGKTRVMATLDCSGLRQVSGQASITIET
uniref:Coagulation factor XIII, A1 polypeptide b n=1 Tax=Xiphophorus couchianus TaxID=32473 RepID=A0A3B5LR85_9TELE